MPFYTLCKSWHSKKFAILPFLHLKMYQKFDDNISKKILDFVLGCIDDIFRKLENSFIGNLLCGITFRSRLQTLQVATKKVKIHCTDGFRNDTKVERRRIYKRTSINNVTNFFLTSQTLKEAPSPKSPLFHSYEPSLFHQFMTQKKWCCLWTAPSRLVA